MPAVMLSDGPHGLRKQKGDHLGLKESIKAVCFPASALSSSFDTGLAEKLGSTLSTLEEECQVDMAFP